MSSSRFHVTPPSVDLNKPLPALHWFAPSVNLDLPHPAKSIRDCSIHPHVEQPVFSSTNSTLSHVFHHQQYGTPALGCGPYAWPNAQASTTLDSRINLHAPDAPVFSSPINDQVLPHPAIYRYLSQEI